MKKAVVVAPHADDELISCGGTILNLVEEGWEVSWILCTWHSNLEYLLAWSAGLEKQGPGEDVLSICTHNLELHLWHWEVSIHGGSSWMSFNLKYD